MSYRDHPLAKALRILEEQDDSRRDKFAGQIVLVTDDTAVIDRTSGITYVTQATWDRMRKAIPDGRD